MRFPEFTDEWKNVKLGDDCEIQMCRRVLAQQTSPTGDVPFFKIGTIGSFPDAYISKSLFDDLRQKYNYPRKGDILISCAGTVGRCVRFNGEPAYFQDSNIVWPKNSEKNYLNDFLYYILAKQTWRHLNTTTIVRIYNDDLRSLSFSCPPIEEQIKIVRLLSLLDERIATQNKIIEDLKKLKSAIVENTYRSQTSVIPLSEILEQVSVRAKGKNDLPVLSVSNTLGFIAQSEQFESREVASADTSNYKIVSEGIIAYNPARINVGSVACCGCGVKGIVSPMYVCFRTKAIALPQYVFYYMRSRSFQLEMEKRLEGSVRLCLTFEGLCNIHIPLPELHEQRHQLERIKAITHKIEMENEYSNLLQLQRQYLLTKMFI